MKKENIRDGLILAVLLVASGFFTWYFGDYFGIWYAQIFNLGFHTFAVIVGTPIAYLLFAFFTVPIFIPRANRFVYLALLLPAILFGLLLGFPTGAFLFPFIFAIIGYVLALLVNWIIYFMYDKHY